MTLKRSVENRVLRISVRSLLSVSRSFTNSPWASMETCFHWSASMPSISVTRAVTSFGFENVGFPSSNSSALAVSAVTFPLRLTLPYGGSLCITYLLPRCSNSSSTHGFESVMSLRSMPCSLRPPLVSPKRA